MNAYKVVKARVTEFPNPVLVRTGENVICVDYSNPEGEWAGWVLCRTNDNEGWLPNQILNIKNSNGIVTEDYCAVEFNLEVGEVLYSNKEMNGWIWCCKSTDSHIYAWAPLSNVLSIS